MSQSTSPDQVITSEGRQLIQIEITRTFVLANDIAWHGKHSQHLVPIDLFNMKEPLELEAGYHFS